MLLYITNNSIKHQSFVYTQLNDQTVLFQTIQFSMSFIYTQFKYKTTLFDLQIEPNQVLPLQARVDLGAMAIKGYRQSPSITGASPSDCLVSYPGHSLVGWGSFPSAEMKSVYSIAPADWAIDLFKFSYKSFDFWNYLRKIRQRLEFIPSRNQMFYTKTWMDQW